MKTASIALITFLVSASAFARPVQKFICKEIDAKTPPKTMIITKIGNTRVIEGRPAKYKLEVFIANSRNPAILEIATVETEDVMFAFEVKGKSIRGMIYLDELDETSLTVNGKTYNFDCR